MKQTGIDALVDSTTCRFLLFAVIMPMNGAIIARGGGWAVLGVVLIGMQLPTFFRHQITAI